MNTIRVLSLGISLALKLNMIGVNEISVGRSNAIVVAKKAICIMRRIGGAVRDERQRVIAEKTIELLQKQMLIQKRLRKEQNKEGLTERLDYSRPKINILAKCSTDGK
jgi:hypothetical protein